MRDALLAIIAKSPNAGEMAMKTLKAIDADSPAAQQRYNDTVTIALGDPSADFEPAERKLLASYVESTNPEVRNLDVRIRVNADEKDAIQEMASAVGQTVSDFVRERVGL